MTAPNSGAEIIPFLKTYVNLPAAIGFTILYSRLCNQAPPDKVFYLVLAPFLSFFAAFGAFIYPNRAFLHPNAAADFLTRIAPSFFLPLIAIFRNWTYGTSPRIYFSSSSLISVLLSSGLLRDGGAMGLCGRLGPVLGLRK